MNTQNFAARYKRTRNLNIVLILVALGLAGWIIALMTATTPAINGIGCDAMEGQVLHIHVQLQLWRNGERVAIPAGVGITAKCMYWLHTHSPDGIVHIEAPIQQTFSLRDFFAVWGKNPIGEKPSVHDEDGIKVLLRGQNDSAFHELAGDWWERPLNQHDIIAIGIGSFDPKDFTFPEGL